MKKFIGLVEKYIIRIVVVSIIGVVVVQGLMTREPMRLYLSWAERMEGQNIEYPVAANILPDQAAVEEEQQKQESPVSPEIRMVLVIDKYSSLPQANILVNGVKYSSFAENRIELDLCAGDVVEIDSTYYNLPVDYVVESVSDNVSFPAAGAVYTANQSIVMLGKIMAK